MSYYSEKEINKKTSIHVEEDGNGLRDLYMPHMDEDEEEEKDDKEAKN